MCHTTNYHHHHHHHRENHRYLRLKSISLRLSLSSSTASTTVSHLPESLTLIFLPRINDTDSNSTAFISLHRVLLHSDVVFTSTDCILACDGVVFEIHAADTPLLRGVFRRYNDGVLKMECKSVYVEKEFCVREVEVCVAEENGVVLKENLVVVKKRRGCRRRRFAVALAEIPEERECDLVEEEKGLSEVGCCCCGEGESEVDEMMEGVGWAVDLGIWAVCLGVGLLVSRASARRSLRRRRKFLV